MKNEVMWVKYTQQFFIIKVSWSMWDDDEADHEENNGDEKD